MTEPTSDPAEPALSYESPRRIAAPAAELGVFGLRLLGIKVAVDLLTQIPTALSLFWIQTTRREGWIAFVVFVLWHVAVAFVLLAFARPIAGVVFGRRDVIVDDLGPASWMTLVVAGAGVTFAIFSADELVAMIARDGLPQPAKPWAQSIDVVVPLIKVAVGLLFFFAPSLLVSPWVARVAPTVPRDE